MGGHESQISPIPPERYGDRFIRFISGITMSRERAEQVRLSEALAGSAGIRVPSGLEGTIDDPRLGGVNIRRDRTNPPGTAEVMEKAELSAERSRMHGDTEDGVPDRSLTTVRSPVDGQEAATLPVIGEAAENASNASRTPSRVTPTPSREDIPMHESVVIGNANLQPEQVGAVPPPTPPKMDGWVDGDETEHHGRDVAPPTPPKADRRSRYDKDLPLPPVATKVFSHSPSRMADEELERARRKVEGAL